MIALLLADGFEEIEALTPVDVLRRAGIPIVTYSMGDDLCVCGAHNIMIDADDYFANLDYDEVTGIILPGGMPGTENLEKNNEVKYLLKHMYENNKLIGAICAAPQILGRLGYLKGKKATCFPDSSEFLDCEYTGDRVCVFDNIITSKGIGTAMDFALAIVEYILGSEKAERLSRSCMYTE